MFTGHLAVVKNRVSPKWVSLAMGYDLDFEKPMAKYGGLAIAGKQLARARAAVQLGSGAC